MEDEGGGQMEGGSSKLKGAGGGGGAVLGASARGGKKVVEMFNFDVEYAFQLCAHSGRLPISWRLNIRIRET